jgi:hypothetical protein
MRRVVIMIRQNEKGSNDTIEGLKGGESETLAASG